MPEHPILIAYDGSEDAKSAITTAGELLSPGPALVVTIWAAAERSVSTSAGLATYAPIFGEIDELERTTARATAEQGCRPRARDRRRLARARRAGARAAAQRPGESRPPR